MRVTLVLIVRPDRGAGGGTDLAWFDELLAHVDRYDIERIAVGDVQGNHLELFSALGYAAARTARVGLGPHVTNVVTRDVGVIAAAAASLDAVSRGRAFFVLSRGDGVTRNLDMRPSTVDELRQGLVAIRDLLYDGQASYRGRNIRLSWPDVPGPRVPLYTTPAGPKMLAMSAAVCDGVYLGTGCTPNEVDGALATISAAERDTPLDVWWVTRAGIGETYEQAWSIASEGISSMGNHSLRGDYGERGVPEELRPALREYHRRYSYAAKNPGAHGGRSGRSQPSNVDLMAELGLTSYFLDRFGIVGTPDQVVDRIRELERRGVHSIELLANSLRELELIGEHVLPRLRQRQEA
jgi:5,10-methylenetetrahydromethanopterin reductase